MFGIKLDISTVTQLGLAAMTGGTSLMASSLLKSVVSQAIQAGIQQFASQMGLPQFATDLLQSRAALAMGDIKGAASNYREAIQGFAGSRGWSPMQAGQMERSADDAYKAVFDAVKKMGEAAAEEASGVGKGKLGKNWIRNLVEIMGKRLDKLAGEMETLGGQIDSGAKKSGELQAVAAEFGLVQGALNNIMKTVSEGQQQLAKGRS
jgi:hypothetical protein